MTPEELFVIVICVVFLAYFVGFHFYLQQKNRIIADQHATISKLKNKLLKARVENQLNEKTIQSWLDKIAELKDQKKQSTDATMISIRE